MPCEILRQKQKAGIAGFLLGKLGALLRFCDGLGGIRAIKQFDQRHRRIVTLTETKLQNAQVAAIAILETRAEFVEQLDDDIAIA